MATSDELVDNRWRLCAAAESIVQRVHAQAQSYAHNRQARAAAARAVPAVKEIDLQSLEGMVNINRDTTKL